MAFIPHEKLSINWINDGNSFLLTAPWVSMELDVSKNEKPWIQDAINQIKQNADNDNVQRFIQELKDYPVYYVAPRTLDEFEDLNLQPCPSLDVNILTPKTFLESYGAPYDDEILHDLPPQWSWKRDEILEKSKIPGTDLYDPVSFVSYLICYRLEWESTSWSGQNGFGHFLETLLKQDESLFFEAIAWISKQSWYVTMESCKAMEPALAHFDKAKDTIQHFINDEIGHHKFMEQVFEAINLNKDNYPVSYGTKWLLDAHRRAAVSSPLAFSAMINLFEAAYYEGQDPISRVIKMSSKPDAAQGYDRHYKINQKHRHCDMPIHLAKYLAPQTHEHLTLTLALFEVTLTTLDQIEKNLSKKFKIS